MSTDVTLGIVFAILFAPVVIAVVISRGRCHIGGRMCGRCRYCRMVRDA